MKRMRALVALVSVSMVALLLSGCLQDGKKYDEEGKRLLESGRYTEALEEYRHIVYGYPGSKYVENAKQAVKKCEAEIATEKIFQKVADLANSPEKKEFAAAAYFLEYLLANYPESSKALEAKQNIDKYKKEQEVKSQFQFAERYFDEGEYRKADGYFQKIISENTDSVFYKDAELMTLKCKEKIEESAKMSAAARRKIEEERRLRQEEEHRQAKLAEEERRKKEEAEKKKSKLDAIKKLDVRVK